VTLRGRFMGALTFEKSQKRKPNIGAVFLALFSLLISKKKTKYRRKSQKRKPNIGAVFLALFSLLPHHCLASLFFPYTLTLFTFLIFVFHAVYVAPLSLLLHLCLASYFYTVPLFSSSNFEKLLFFCLSLYFCTVTRNFAAIFNR
jgi:hypothetical protein